MKTKIIKDRKDATIFIENIVNPPRPNKTLVEAIKKYNKK